ncbi:hypothetical protein QEN71_40140 (plasmid) [Paraburkholderia sabiae]|nr:hypothetical protein QEN71_40140 [Paraburkholderia sabiae]
MVEPESSNTIEEFVATVGARLRSMVEDWLAPDPERGIRVSHFGRSATRRYVRVVADNRTGPRGMFFFRHSDGKWCIFPPDPERPAMHASRAPEFCLFAASVGQVG